ncbi:NAD(P)-dependent oxidoreductase [Wenxinia marina]|uniref:3-hydroxyisobutyrate dehydrogenase n=1 Tax=Wenxinia marina DSM 24838 TaxID=1123501 RepID=A0A0D0NIC9_9RHOB|nr:NAD(P)-dependent oxidoreductase [Wenxinia marina]KIQ68085.1 3-hydroxyisobutyrate dehydrogenase [Wenxinia marina DSM 24838]GGL78077.1 hypothetical protein GCM10011392_35790 [Wenxinia marina]
MSGAVAIVGLGAMGGGLARRAIGRGLTVHVLDADPARVADAVAAGTEAADDLPTLARSGATVLLSLPSPEIAEEVATALLPHLSPGQIVADLGTMTPTACRRIAAAYSEAGARFIDVPVTGGPDGARAGTLRLFAAGDAAAVDEAAPLLSTFGEVVPCGGSGAGQATKLVNQMGMGLVNAVLLEALAYGRSAGLDPADLGRAVGGESGWRAEFAALARRVADETARGVGIKHGQLAYVLGEADTVGQALPTTRAAFEFCEGREATIREANRMSPSYWDALLTADA